MNKKEWNFHPKFPLEKNPLFLFPFSIKKIFNWYRKMWFPPSEIFVCLLFALTLWYFVNPLLGNFTINFETQLNLAFNKNKVRFMSACTLKSFFIVCEKLFQSGLRVMKIYFPF